MMYPPSKLAKPTAGLSAPPTERRPFMTNPHDLAGEYDPHRFANTPPPPGPGLAPAELPRPDFLTSLLRGWRRLCPQCGTAPAFSGYLKLRPECPTCGAGLGRVRADDFPPYVTIILVGHIIVPLILLSEKVLAPAMWVDMTVWPLTTLALTIALLPVVKGAVVGLMWFLGMRGDET